MCITLQTHTHTHTHTHRHPHTHAALPEGPSGHARVAPDVYADPAWQQQILLYTPSSYCLCSARHGSLTHRRAAWRQIDCEHPDCPSCRGVWQSSDSHAGLIPQACCLFSPAAPAPPPPLVCIQGPTPPAAASSATYPCHHVQQLTLTKLQGCAFPFLCFPKLFPTPGNMTLSYEWQLNAAQTGLRCSDMDKCCSLIYQPNTECIV